MSASSLRQYRRSPLTQGVARVVILSIVAGSLPLPADAAVTRRHTFDAGWQLVSMPLRPTDPAPASVFGDLLAPRRLYDYAAGQTLGLGEPGFSNVTPGRAHWLLLPAPATVEVRGDLVSTQTPHSVPLAAGWNAVSNPWPVAAEWSDARVSVKQGSQTLPLSQAVSQGWIDPNLEAADALGTAYTAVEPNTGSVLESWKGYLAYSHVAAELLFTPPPPDATPPVVEIVSPADGDRVTGPVEIVGSADDPNLVSWVLEHSHGRNRQFTTLAVGDAPVVGGVLASFDPTLLKNGLHVIRLTATDAAGLSSSAEVAVIVKDNLKVGHFSVSFVDLEVPVAGIPIRVTRTYDSRDRARGDFGHGWSLDVSTVRVEARDSLGLGWVQTSTGGAFPQYCLQPTQAHPVAVTMADGRVYEFDPVLSPSCQNFAPLTSTNLSFVARAGSPATLVPIGGGEVDVVGSVAGPVQLFSATSFDLLDPARYQFARPDQRRFVIHKDTGLESLTDRNGNQLLVTAGGILHSSGLSVVFTRDGAGRITQISDPAGELLGYGYDAAGDLVSFTDREQNETRFTYSIDLPHFLEQIQDPLGRTPIRNDYDTGGRLLRHTDAFGKTIEYSHDVAGRREIVVDRNGKSRLLEYDERGNVTRETDHDGRVTERSFDERNNRLTETDPLLHTTTYTYDDNDDVLTVEDPAGNVTEYTYDGTERVLTTKDARGKLTTNAYDAAGNLLTVEDPAGNVTAYTYDAGGNVKTQTVTVGGAAQTTSYDYNQYGHLFRETDASGHVTTYGLDIHGNRRSQTTTRTLPGGGSETLVTQYDYDRNGRIIKTTDPDGTFTRTVYDALGKQIESWDKLDRKTTYEYDDLGRLIKTTYPDLTFDETAYDNEGRRTSSKDRGGRTTLFEYDALGRLGKTTYADASFTTNVYDAASRLESTSDARGKTTSYEYDAAGRRTKVRDPLGNETLFGYDANGNQTNVRDARGRTTTSVYDDLNRRTRTIFPDATFTETGYDELGRRVSERDQAGKVTQFRYDALGRLTKVVDADAKETTYGYDEVGNRTSQTDANNNTTRFEYDRLGRETKRTLPDGKSETRAYDAAGNLATWTDFMLRTTSFDYDESNRVQAKHLPDGRNVGYTYTATGRRQSVTDARGATTYGYDNRDRLTSFVQPGAGRLEYGYDPNGNRTSLTARIGAAAFTTAYGYDDGSRLDTVTDPNGRLYDFAWDPNGNRASLAYPNATTTTYGYDDLNRLRTLTTTGPLGVVQGYSFTLGPAGNRERIDEADGTVRSYTYDNLYRLTGETVAGLLSYQKSFTYDNVGNRQTQTTTGHGAGSLAYSYDNRDRLVADATTYTWDDNGNLTGKLGEAGYVFDVENRLTRVTKLDGTLIETVYDDAGNRVQTRTTLPGQPTQVANYLVDTSDGLSHVVAELDATATGVQALYVRGGDDLLSVLRGSGTRFFHPDGIGSIRRLTDEAGNITDGYTYSAFGEQLSHTGTDPQPYAFAGEPYDPNVGFQHHRARWMDPRVGRFVGMDPWEGSPADPPTLHRYTYAGGDPASKEDPSGRFSVAEGFAVAAIISVIASAAFSLTSALSSYGAVPIVVDSEALIVDNSGWEEGDALAALRGAAQVWASQAAIHVNVRKIRRIPDQRPLRFVQNPWQVRDAANAALPYMTVSRGLVSVFVGSNGVGQGGVATVALGKGLTFFSGNLPWPNDLLLAHEWGHTFGLPDQGIRKPPFSLEPLVLFGNLMTTWPTASLTPGQRVFAREFAQGTYR